VLGRATVRPYVGAVKRFLLPIVSPEITGSLGGGFRNFHSFFGERSFDRPRIDADEYGFEGKEKALNREVREDCEDKRNR
jgi:hypothetical protein